MRCVKDARTKSQKIYPLLSEKYPHCLNLLSLLFVRPSLSTNKSPLPLDCGVFLVPLSIQLLFFHNQTVSYTVLALLRKTLGEVQLRHVRITVSNNRLRGC